ncbi:gamma-glutamyl-gamma-aminobutyrate hydrolase family protein [Halomonas sp. hl-4]|uniref:gamma-glutamyl-gamma-aminobutyrate hydrolase family protein n=1 Tax=Halomonas sp. hl-4 TaxID=1761789 RepID=UPI000BB93C33|nr:gamma-glutamyl-gamma-aminobutyrate hydrolase family protein [Halomonas sp. hl-4]SNY98599.1 putative glutamine amidotransferase [Halomonas sp. hl-4]
MKRVAISQRQDAIEGRNEVRDSLDTRMAELLWQLGFLPMPLPNTIANPEAYLDKLAPDAIVLSGGNDIGSATHRDALEKAALDHAIHHNIPVLGICRGLQMFNHYQGGRLRSVADHIGNVHWVTGPLTPKSGRWVNSYHGQGLTVDDLGYDLKALAWANDGTIEALCHYQRPWLGIMWHPERDSPIADADRHLINTFLTQGTLP